MPDTKEDKVNLTNEDFREALKAFGSYVDITEDDLHKLYDIALKAAKERSAHSWLASDIMTSDVVSVRSDTDVHEVGKLLIQNKISGLPVVDEGNRVVGMLTNSDLLSIAGIPSGHVINDAVMKYILHKAVPRHKQGKTAGDLMSRTVTTVNHDTSVKQIASILDKKGIKRVPVVDEDNRLLGIVSGGDIIKILYEGEGENKKNGD
jgi:CBS-domain-containing membrane protein